MSSREQGASLIDAVGKGAFASSVQLLRERAAHGDAVAPIALGHIYFRGGDGVRKDYGEALYWFGKVDGQDDVTGFVAAHLATIYFKGLGVAKNHRLAARYLRRAALRGYGGSRVLFAVLQKRGDGTLRKPRAAQTVLRASVCDTRLGLLTRFMGLVWLWP